MHTSIYIYIYKNISLYICINIIYMYMYMYIFFVKLSLPHGFGQHRIYVGSRCVSTSPAFLLWSGDLRIRFWWSVDWIKRRIHKYV